MSLKMAGNQCRAFYSRDGELLAVSVEDTARPHANPRVVVADLHAGKWLRDTPYAATVAEDARGPLVGFLGDTHTIWLMSGGTYFPDEERALLYPVLIDLPDGMVHVGLLGFRGPAFNSANGAVDGRNRQVWSSALQDACGFSSQPLGEKDEVKPGAILKGDALRAQGCSQPSHVLALTERRLLVAFSVANTYRITRVDADGGTSPIVSVNAKGREGFFTPIRAAISPDSKVSALEVVRFDDTRSGVRRSDREILVLQSDPLTLAGTLHIAEGTELLAVHSRGGSIEVATADKSGKIGILNLH